MRLTDGELETAAICAARYALGRETYVVGDVTRLLERVAPALGAPVRATIARDIRDALAEDRAGHPKIDAPRWRETLRTLEPDVAPPPR